jgi:hypothetical protein
MGPSVGPCAKDTSISTDLSDRLSLDNIRASLIRQEDSIIFSLIERAQYRLNSPVYQAGGRGLHSSTSRLSALSLDRGYI